MNIEFMEEAILLAKEAFSRGEVPVGAVIVKKNETQHFTRRSLP